MQDANFLHAAASACKPRRQTFPFPLPSDGAVVGDVDRAAVRWLARRYRLPWRRAELIAALAGFGSEARL